MIINNSFIKKKQFYKKNNNTDSPVSIDSFITAVPFSKMISHGINQCSGISIISPGTKSKLLISYFIEVISVSIIKLLFYVYNC